MSKNEEKIPKQCPECEKWHNDRHQICNKCLREDGTAEKKIKTGVAINVFSF
ncbi:MAG: hypothetical protein WA057_01595 [Candidatus Magasanikiibacteriota bacterium]